MSPEERRCLESFGAFLKTWAVLPQSDGSGAVERMCMDRLGWVNWHRARSDDDTMKVIATVCADELLSPVVYDHAVRGVRESVKGIRSK